MECRYWILFCHNSVRLLFDWLRFLKLVHEPENDKLGRADCSHADLHNHPALQNILRWHRLPQPHLDEEGVLGRGTRKPAISPDLGQRGFDLCTDLYPSVRWMRFKHDKHGRC